MWVGLPPGSDSGGVVPKWENGRESVTERVEMRHGDDGRDRMTTTPCMTLSLSPSLFNDSLSLYLMTVTGVMTDADSTDGRGEKLGDPEAAEWLLW